MYTILDIEGFCHQIPIDAPKSYPIKYCFHQHNFGCRLCSLTSCQVCEKDYNKDPLQFLCVKDSESSTNKILNCAHHIVDYINFPAFTAQTNRTEPRCYECLEGYVLGSTENICHSIESDSILVGCRIYADNSNQTCLECLGDYEAAEDNKSCIKLDQYLTNYPPVAFKSATQNIEYKFCKHNCPEWKKLVWNAIDHLDVAGSWAEGMGDQLANTCYTVPCHSNCQRCGNHPYDCSTCNMNMTPTQV